MFATLKNHPFPVKAFFENSIVLTFAFQKGQIQPMIPKSFCLDTYQDTWAFVAVAVVKTSQLRPQGFPRFLGNEFILVGYRVFVTYVNKAGKRLRGLYILKSETNKKKMEIMGNVFTHYGYTTTDVQQIKDNGQLKFISLKSDLNLQVGLKDTEVLLPASSPFPDWKTARRFSGPLPFTFNYDSSRSEVLIVEGARENWRPKPISVISYKIGFLETEGFELGILANAFIVSNVNYSWKKGRLEKWPQ